ncbi:ankyrin repeat domain-containing protein 50 [Microdochium nivale]|nr:ankyrin repeat domain-containing protein 50 [Microdochium nivale]
MAASYGGLLGPRLETPWDWVAKAQWILKAVELGSYGTASMIVEDDDIMTVLEALGPGVLELRRPFFNSPEVDVARLRLRVEEFAKIGDEVVASKLMPLICGSSADPQPPNSDTLDQAAGKEEADKTENKTHGSPGRDDFLRRFTITRGSDLSFLDLDALDINFENKEDIVKSAYNNDLEAFVVLLSEEDDPSLEKLHYYASVAAMNGSLEVVRFLTEQYSIGPNGAWQENTHFEDSILFGRGKIVRYYLSKGVDLEPKEPHRPSVMHYLLRSDDEPLARLVCNQLRDCGGLRRTLSWVPTGEMFHDTTPLGAAMSAGAWKIACLTLQLGVEVDADMRIEQVLELAVTPCSPAVPIELLRMILRCGGDPNAFVQDSSNPALQWPVWTSNVSATQELLLHGAKPVLSDEHDFLLLAKEILQQRRDECPVDVVDEDGKVIQGSWEHARSASAVVLDMLTIAAEGQPEGKIQEVIRSADPACLGKYWMVVGKGPGMGAIEVETPFFVEATQGYTR